MNKISKTIKNPQRMFHFKQKFIKKINSDIATKGEKQLNTKNNVGSSSVKYLDKWIRKFRYKVNCGVNETKRLVRTEGKKNIQMKSFEQIGGKELKSFINMFSIQSMTALFVTGHLGNCQIPANTGNFFDAGQFGIDLHEQQKTPKEVASERYSFSCTTSDKCSPLKSSYSNNPISSTVVATNNRPEVIIKFPEFNTENEQKEYMRKYYLKNKEAYRIRQRIYQIKYRLMINRRNKLYKRKNSEKWNSQQRQYYEKNKEKVIETRREFYKTNREKWNEYQREKYAQNRERYKEYQKQYRQRQKEKLIQKKLDNELKVEEKTSVDSQQDQLSQYIKNDQVK